MTLPPPPPPASEPAVPAGNKKALWAMILGIVSFVCCGIFASVPALVLGLQAKKEIEASGGTQTGSGQATAGIVLAIIGIVWTVIAVIVQLSSR